MGGDGGTLSADPESPRVLMPPPPPLKHARSEVSDQTHRGQKFYRVENEERAQSVLPQSPRSMVLDAQSENSAPPPPYRSEDEMSENFQATPENVHGGDPTLEAPFEGNTEFWGNFADWGPWCENVDGQLRFLLGEFDRLENGVF